jgi:glycosyltransferase involved in cell wall biosynthesis
MAGAELRELAAHRTLPVRLLEGSSLWWRRALRGLDVGVWSTDTLPLVRIPGAAGCLTVHDLRFLHGKRYLGLGRYLLLHLRMGPALRRADAVVTVSAWTASRIRRRYDVPRERLHVVPNAVDPAMAREAEGAPRPCDRPYVLAVGHLERRKNLRVLVEAFAGLEEASGHLLVLAGADCGEGAALRRVAERTGVADRLVLAGRVTENRLAALYAGCSALVCPSLYEGFGMTLLEGMSAGAPVVASSIPPHREVGGEVPLWVEPDSDMPERLRDALGRVLRDGGLSEQIRRGGRERARLFSWGRSAGLLGDVYAGLLEPGGPSVRPDSGPPEHEGQYSTGDGRG